MTELQANALDDLAKTAAKEKELEKVQSLEKSEEEDEERKILLMKFLKDRNEQEVVTESDGDGRYILSQNYVRSKLVIDLGPKNLFFLSLVKSLTEII